MEIRFFGFESIKILQTNKKAKKEPFLETVPMVGWSKWLGDKSSNVKSPNCKIDTKLVPRRLSLPFPSVLHYAAFG